MRLLVRVAGPGFAAGLVLDRFDGVLTAAPILNWAKGLSEEALRAELHRRGLKAALVRTLTRTELTRGATPTTGCYRAARDRHPSIPRRRLLRQHGRQLVGAGDRRVTLVGREGVFQFPIPPRGVRCIGAEDEDTAGGGGFVGSGFLLSFRFESNVESLACSPKRGDLFRLIKVFGDLL
jgi:hypothetical protein